MKKRLLIVLIFAGMISISNAQTQLINSGDTWKYLDDGSNQGTAWIAKDFNDATWKSGPSMLGYSTDGTDTVKTTVGYGSDINNKYITTYFRKTINIADASKIISLSSNIIRDDGIVVYLNGSEVLRDNMPTGTITYTTLSSTVLGDPSENYWNTFSLDATKLVTGDNVFAVEIHQGNLTSTDIMFDMKLTATIQNTNSIINVQDDKKQNVKIYPNPIVNSAIIEFKNENSNYTFSLYNTIGDCVKTLINNGEKNIILEKENLTQGIYFYKVTDQNGQISAGKIIIQ